MSGGGGAGMPPEAPHQAEEEEGWLLSFADLVVNMMALFLVLYSISDPDPGKFETAAQSITQAFTGKDTPPPPTPFQQLVQQMNQQLVDAGIEVEGADAQVNRRGTTFEFKTGEMFATGGAAILPAAEPLLDRVAQNLLFLGIQNYRIDIEGHTDDAPINTPQFPSNWELSSARAAAVARFLISRGIKPDRISVIGYADTKPKVPNRDPAGNPIPENRQENRRVMVRVER